MGAWRLRPVASFHFERRLERSAAGRGTRDPGGQADRGRQRSPCRRRHGAAEEGLAFGRVAPQYASALGKTANCQTLVSLTLARDEVPVMIGLRLFLPESWTGDADRMTKARVPEDRRIARTKPEIALAEIDRIRAAGVR